MYIYTAWHINIEEIYEYDRYMSSGKHLTSPLPQILHNKCKDIHKTSQVNKIIPRKDKRQHPLPTLRVIDSNKYSLSFMIKV